MRASFSLERFKAQCGWIFYIKKLHPKGRMKWWLVESFVMFILRCEVWERWHQIQCQINSDGAEQKPEPGSGFYSNKALGDATLTSSSAGSVDLWLNKCVHTLHTQFDMMGKYFHFKYSPGDYCLNSMLSNNLKVSRMLEGPEVAGRWVWHNRNTGSQGDLNIVDLNDQSSNCFFILFFIFKTKSKSQVLVQTSLKCNQLAEKDGFY